MDGTSGGQGCRSFEHFEKATHIFLSQTVLVLIAVIFINYFYANASAIARRKEASTNDFRNAKSRN